MSNKYGWIPDLPDIRDRKFAYAGIAPTIYLPESVDLRVLCPLVYHQLKTGSCVANALGAAHQIEQMRHRGVEHAFVPSRLFVYYNARALNGTVREDAGTYIRTGIKTMVADGVCPETVWPYDESRFDEKPGMECYALAANHQVLSYHRINQTLAEMQICLAEGYPFAFGFTVYTGFESSTVTRTGEGQLPRRFERALGGHAVLAVGYDNRTKRFLIRNSWGDKWGQKGYFTLPYEYLTSGDLSADFWTIRMIELPLAKRRKTK